MISDNPTVECGYCFFHGNAATTGGGVHIEANGALLFYKAVLMYNSASFSGGGVYIGQYSQPQFDCNFSRIAPSKHNVLTDFSCKNYEQLGWY